MDNQRVARQEQEAPDVVAGRGAPARTTGAIGDDLSPGELTAQRLTRPTPGHTDESRAGVEDKALHERLAGLDNAELARLSVLEEGTALEQGGTYVDLNDLGRGPFSA